MVAVVETTRSNKNIYLNYKFDKISNSKALVINNTKSSVVRSQ